MPWPPPGDLPDPGIKPRSPALQVDFLPADPQGKPRMFPDQDLNLCLLHWQVDSLPLNHQRSPRPLLLKMWSASASLGSLLEMQTHRSHLTSSESGFLGLVVKNLHFNNTARSVLLKPSMMKDTFCFVTNQSFCIPYEKCLASGK